jgi:hypothetical protein
MNRLARASYAFLTAWLLQLGNAHADPAALVLDEPETAPQSGMHRLQVSDDGMARLHLKWGSGEPASGVELLLTPFNADSQPPASVAFDSGKADAPLLSFLRGVTVPAAGTELRLAAPALLPDLEYTGKLYATAGHRTFIWDVTLVRPGALGPFVCRPSTRILAEDGSANIELQRVAPIAEKSITLRLSPFVSKEQELGDVGILVDAEKNIVRAAWPDFPVAGTAGLQVPIRTAGLSEGSAYTGQLLFLVGTRELMQCSLTLQMPKVPRGDLVIDPQALSRTVMQTFWRGSTDEHLSVILRDKTRAHRLDGMTATLDGVSEAPGGSFDPGQHLKFSVNGLPVSNFMGLELPIPAAEVPVRTIRAGGQMNVDLKLVDLHAGKYSFTLRFNALNGADTPPKLDVVVNVRHHVMRAVIAMLIALLASFFLTKGIANWRERTRIRARVAQLREESFAVHQLLPTAVFMRAVLAQTEKLLQPVLFVPPPPSVYDYVTRAERSAAVLRSYASLQDSLQSLPIPEARPHYQDAIDNVMRRIGPEPLDQRTTDSVVNDLGALAATLSDPLTWYWSALKSKAKVLLREAPRLVGGAGDQDVIKDLLDALATPPPESTLTYDDAYWIVKLLESRRMFDADLVALTTAYSARSSLDDVFRQGDLLAWQRLTQAVEDGRASIARLDPEDDLECLQPAMFIIEFKDRVLAESYLVSNILEYVWSFDLTASAEGSATAPHSTWSETLKSPRITQYMPFAGNLKISVKIRWPGADDGVKAKELELTADPIDVGENSELGLVQSLDKSELVLLGIIFVITLLTGLPALYFGKPSFGSFMDYIAILAWAVGVDQGKNLIQLMKTFPADTGATTP